MSFFGKKTVDPLGAGRHGRMISLSRGLARDLNCPRKGSVWCFGIYRAFFLFARSKQRSAVRSGVRTLVLFAWLMTVSCGHDRGVTLAQGLVIMPGKSVSVPATLCLDAGWLEQIACSSGTREHESLLRVDVSPHLIHTALLAAGFKPGHPGAWQLDAVGELHLHPPNGDPLQVLVEHSGRTFPVTNWVIGDGPLHWRFAGSMQSRGYAANRSGSIVGLVTFGDEVVGCERVVPDRADVVQPSWEVAAAIVPPIGTHVRMVLSMPPE